MSLCKSIFVATLQERYPLTKKGSTKTIYHVRLEVDTADLQIKPGDSLGIFGQNDPSCVQQLIRAIHASGDELIVDSRSKQEMTLRDFLTRKANLSRLTSMHVRLACETETDLVRKARLSSLLQQEMMKEYIDANHPIDFFEEYPSSIPLQVLCDAFSPMLPRFYSVASSPLVLPGGIDLTVALIAYPHKQRICYGVASYFLCHLAMENMPISFYVQSSGKFSLPDPKADIIMIGPGTGIAPFRAFMQEREKCHATGKNWLFFGDRHRAFDFFYKEYWSSLVEMGMLRLSTAFSRDQEQKIYVQDRMLEEAKDFFQWIERGAYLYICGDAQKMAKDVEQTLVSIVSAQGNVSVEKAKEYVKFLKKEGRYLVDVY